MILRMYEILSVMLVPRFQFLESPIWFNATDWNKIFKNPGEDPNITLQIP